MKILLINPQQTIPEPRKFYLSIPLGLLYISAVLEKQGFEVKVFDCLADKKVVRDRGFFRYGVSFERVKEEIEKEKPDIVGVSNPFSSQIENAVECCKLTKEVDKSIITVLGGPHVSCFPVEVLEENDCIDVCVFGEGEYAFLEIAEQMCKTKPDLGKVNGIAYRKRGGIIKNPKMELISPLDKLPLPSYHLVEIEKYLERPYVFSKRGTPKIRSLPLITSRGCPNNCVFCSISSAMGRVWRPHSAEYTIAHIEFLVKNFSVEHIHFEDDNLTLSKERIHKILDGMVEEGLEVSWDTPNGVRADTLDAELVAKFKKTNCTRLVIGVESGSQRVLDNIINKRLKLEDVVNAARLCKQQGIDLYAFFVIGFPGETIKDMNKTVDFALMLFKKYNVKPHLYIANPIPGTRLHKQCLEQGHIGEFKPIDLIMGSELSGTHLIHTHQFNEADVDKIVKRFNRGLRLLILSNPLKHRNLLFQEIKRRILVWKTNYFAGA